MHQQQKALEESLNDVLQRTRVGDFQNAHRLLKAIDKTWLRLQSYPSGDSHSDYLQLRYAALAAELADHDGLTIVADAELKRCKDSVLDDVQRPGPNASALTPSEWRLERQKLLFVLQVAINRYRYGGNRAVVKTILAATRRRAETMVPQSNGLLTQLYYAEAKLHLRFSAFAEAVTMYRECLGRASARFSLAPRQSDDPNEAERLANRRKIEKDAARYTVAKILAFGLGRTFFEQGRLEEARAMVVAGELLLEATHDTPYRYHANLLLGAIERDAAAASDAETFQSARSRFEECLKFFSSDRRHMLLRVQYELGLLELRVGNFGRAEELMRAALMAAEKGNRKRWSASTLIALARIARKRKQFEMAVHTAETAFDVATAHDLPRARSEALSAKASALAEAGMARKDPSLLFQAETVLDELLQTCDRRDSKARVMPQLLLARVRYARHDKLGARDAYDDYQRISADVQIRVREFADTVRRELYPEPDSA